MADNKTKIIPKEVAVINNITSITIQVASIVFNTSAVLFVSLYDDNDKYISTVNLDLKDDDYTNWGNNDDYLLHFVCEKLNITPFSPEPEPVLEMPQELQ